MNYLLDVLELKEELVLRKLILQWYIFIYIVNLCQDSQDFAGRIERMLRLSMGVDLEAMVEPEEEEAEEKEEEDKDTEEVDAEGDKDEEKTEEESAASEETPSEGETKTEEKEDEVEVNYK